MVIEEKKRERIEKLAALRKQKEEEIKEIEEEKKKELSELQKKLKQEMDEAEERINSEIEGVSNEEEEEMLKVLRKTFKIPKEEEKEDLEETVKQQKLATKEEQAQNTTYKPMEEILSSPDNIYARSDIYSELKTALDKVQSGEYLNQEERSSFYKIQKEFSTGVHQTKEDSFGYIGRSKELLKEIDSNLHYKP